MYISQYCVCTSADFQRGHNSDKYVVKESDYFSV